MRVKLRPPLLTLAALALAATALGAGRPSPQALRAMLSDILASGYQLQPPVRIRVEEWLTWLLSRLGRLLSGWSQSGPLAGLPPWALWVLVGVCVVLLGLIVGHIVLTVRRVLVEPAVRARRELDERPSRDPRRALAEAEAALARGEYERAVRLLYRAALLRLDRLGALVFDPARTNWENLSALSSTDSHVRAAMAGLTGAVDGVVYGGAQASARVAEDCRELVRRLWRAEVVSA